MADEPLVPRDELTAALAARRELGEEFEPQLVEAFAERIERRLAERTKQVPEKKSPQQSGQQFVLALASIGMGIPITAVAVEKGGLLGLLIAWTGIVLVNWVFSRD
jgi:hypothetical protein